MLRGLIDGDELTASFVHPPRIDGRPNAAVFYTLDLGVPIALDSLVFFPPQSGFTDDNRRQRNVFPVGYEVTRTNTPTDWLIFEDEAVALGSPGYHPLDELVGSTFSQQPEHCVAAATFALYALFALQVRRRHIAGHSRRDTGLRPRLSPSGALLELISQVKSFGEPVSLGRLTWHFTRYRQTSSGRIVEDPTAPVQLIIQTRSGTDDDPIDHFIFDELSRLLKVDRPTYEDAPRVVHAAYARAPGFQASRGEDTENWTPCPLPT